MAVRKKSDKTASAPRKRAPKKKSVVEEELQNVGADVVPSVEISVGGGSPTQLLADWDLHLFNEGTHHKLWEKLGAHIVPGGVIFGVWAPNAARVSVVGDFNDWNTGSHPLEMRGASGIWEGFIPDIKKGTKYKYHIVSRFNDYEVNKADPFGVHHETPPQTASIVWDLDYEWNDAEWMKTRAPRNAYDAPMSTYEVHLGSWGRVSDDDGKTWRSMSYREIAPRLAGYVKKMNFTHVELMPIMEHPFYGSWGYQITGYFAPTSRYGTPQDFKYLIDVLHQHDIGVILDWVPSHFPSDEHGLTYFDGTHLFEHADPRKGFHPDWNSLIFNYGRNEVRSFLLSSALYWLDEYHIDGLRVDAVASMLYLDYSRKHGEWVPNEFGGRENIEAISFLRRVNEDVYKVHPDVQTIAEESTAWPMVSRPTYVGGLGFGMKWDMGWMHDTLRYFAKDPIHRKFHHNDLTFRMMYAFTENFVLPLSHDEVVHGKGSLMGKMRGDEWQRAANLRLLFSLMYANPGKKLLFMGAELGQYREWNHDGSLDWHLLDSPIHRGINRWLEDLNKAYRDVPAFHELDMSPEGFEWVDCCDTENSVVSLLRRSKSNPNELLIAVMNFTEMPRHNYQIGVPRGGHWAEVLNSDATIYGGSGQGNMGGLEAAPIPLHGRKWSVTMTLPPLGAVFLLAREEAAEIEPAETEPAEIEEDETEAAAVA
ncbi:MAG TPA: 1,4-alpha-glucan branching protein GlgB [Thermoanaerobaculia bacterium]|nr:1,4-alpha-glucan branching protein GlgB [Thermoanaerobaculia bacterium]